MQIESRTIPTLTERADRNPVQYGLLCFIVLFSLIGMAELLCTLAGAAFDPRLG